MARVKSSVHIPDSLLEKILIIRTEADSKAIAEKAGVNVQTVYNAFKTGQCQAPLLEVIESYYEDKINMMYEYLGVSS